jgi:hypothetical protein
LTMINVYFRTHHAEACRCHGGYGRGVSAELGTRHTNPQPAVRTRGRWVNGLIWQLLKPDLSDEETDALARLLSDKIDNDRSPLSARIQTLKAIPAKLRPEPVRTLLPKRIAQAEWRRGA